MRHAELAESVGIPRDNIKVAEDGELIQLTPETCEVFGREGRSGRVLVDGKPEFELEDIVLRDRIQLSEDGIVVPIIVLHSDMAADPGEDGNAEVGDADKTDLPPEMEVNAGEIEIISRGFVYMDKSGELIEEAKEIALRVIENLSDEQKHETETVQDEIRSALRRFFSKQMQRSPLVFPVVMRV